MAEQFDLTNLTLDDNNFEVVPEGTYHFTVDSHDIDYATSDKLPPNTQVIIVHLAVPFKDKEDGSVKTAKIRTNFNVWKKALFALRTFAECIGMSPEKGRFVFNHKEIDGMSGVCELEVFETKNGNEVNRVKMFYPPSKAPLTTLNDDVWAGDGFLAMGGDEDDLFASVPG